MQYNLRNSKLSLSAEPLKNMLRINGDDFILEEIGDEGGKGGGNSRVFRAQHPDGDEAYVVKFFRWTREDRYVSVQKRLERFEREIRALEMARDSSYNECVVAIVDHGIRPINVEDGRKISRKTLRYYVMEEADSDLLLYLAENDLSLQQKVLLCAELLRILRGLHALGIYHRDIKPGNILMHGGSPVFADLGLINFRKQDSDLDEITEKVGPIGFLSPEATNKCLGIRTRDSFCFDCWIDEKSDIYQLGQLFWLVLQDEVPTGHLHGDDLRNSQAATLLEIIQSMLQYGKPRRATIESLEAALKPVLRQLALA